MKDGNQRIQELEATVQSLLDLCMYAGDFRNGNVHSGIDEGNVIAQRVIDKALMTLNGGYENGNQ